MKSYLIKKKKFHNLFMYICLFLFVPIDYIARITDELTILTLLRIALCAFTFILYIRRKKLSVNILFIFFFTCLLNISTFLNHGSLVLAVYGHLYLLLGICCFMEYHLERSDLIILYYRYCFFWIVLNIFSILLWPKGLYVAPGDMGTGINFLLGNYNSFIKLILPALGIGYFLLKKKRISFKNYLFLWFLVFVTYLLVDSMTSRVAVFLLAIFLLLFNQHIFAFGVNPVVSATILTVVTFIFALNPIEWMQMKLAQITGKSLTFSGRTILWERMVDSIQHAILLGYGMQDREFLVDKFQLPYAGKAHNLIIQILYQTGIIGLLLFSLIFFAVSYCLLKKTDGKIERCLKCVLLVISVMFCFDFYSYVWIFQMFLILTYCVKQSGSHLIAKKSKSVFKENQKNIVKQVKKVEN